MFNILCNHIDLTWNYLFQARVLDLVNNAAYRSGLGNSIFVKEHNISKIKSETVSRVWNLFFFVYIFSELFRGNFNILGKIFSNYILNSFAFSGYSLQIFSPSVEISIDQKYGIGHILLP